MIKTTISSRNKIIITSGSVITFDNEPITIKIFDDGQQIISLQFIFQTNADVKEPAMVSTVTNDTLILTLTNFDNPIGTGSTKPINFAKYKNKTLYLHFRVNALSESDKTLYYTVYAEGGFGNE